MTEIPLPVPAPQALPTGVIDSHCHLDIIQSTSGLDIGRALTTAADVGVVGVVDVGVDVDSSRRSVEIAKEHPAVVGAVVGIHPNAAPTLLEMHTLGAELEAIAALGADPSVIGIGETGLDYFRTEAAGRQAQHESFRAHIQLAKDLNKTLVIHDRDAHDDVLAILNEVGAPQRVIFHCFSGGPEMARFVSDSGWYLSFAGVVTFKNAESLREALDVADRERILVETDAPYLTPTPNRGKPNASYLMPDTVRVMAQRRGVEVGELGEQLFRNTHAAFGLS
ncbi:MAG: TatD family hydrolase [Actinobacteria bacterium]|nr:TatD family hydrolase [Actinomycetota bacterium]